MEDNWDSCKSWVDWGDYGRWMGKRLYSMWLRKENICNDTGNTAPSTRKYCWWKRINI